MWTTCFSPDGNRELNSHADALANEGHGHGILLRCSAPYLQYCRFISCFDGSFTETNNASIGFWIGTGNDMDKTCTGIDPREFYPVLEGLGSITADSALEAELAACVLATFSLVGLLNGKNSETLLAPILNSRPTLDEVYRLVISS